MDRNWSIKLSNIWKGNFLLNGIELNEILNSLEKSEKKQKDKGSACPDSRYIEILFKLGRYFSKPRAKFTSVGLLRLYLHSKLLESPRSIFTSTVMLDKVLGCFILCCKLFEGKHLPSIKEISKVLSLDQGLPSDTISKAEIEILQTLKFEAFVISPYEYLEPLLWCYCECFGDNPSLSIISESLLTLLYSEPESFIMNFDWLYLVLSLICSSHAILMKKAQSFPIIDWSCSLQSIYDRNQIISLSNKILEFVLPPFYSIQGKFI